MSPTLERLIADRTVQALALVALLIAAIGSTLVFVIKAQEGRIKREIAANAPTMQPAEARLAEMKATVAHATAQASAKLKAAEAEIAVQKARAEEAAAQVADIERQATADKEEAQARTQRAIAQVAEQKSRLEAELNELKTQTLQLLQDCCGLREGAYAAAAMQSSGIFPDRNPNYGIFPRRKRGLPMELNRVPIPCRDKWLRWRNANSYGAIAVNEKATDCGFSANMASMDEADAEALRFCQASVTGASRCAVMQRLVPPEPMLAAPDSKPPYAAPQAQRQTSAIIPAVAKPVGFKTFDNQDMMYGDIRILKDISRDGCMEACRADPGCKAYSYDKWNSSCYPKSELHPFSLSARSLTAVREDVAVPGQSPTQMSFERFHNRAFPSPSHERRLARSLTGCEAVCADTGWCVAYTFIGARNACELYKTTGAYNPQTGADSGAKIQSDK